MLLTFIGSLIFSVCVYNYSKNDIVTHDEPVEFEK